MKKLNVFYDSKQSVKRNSSFSPSAGKPKLVVEAWKKTKKVNIKAFRPMKVEDIALAHSLPYVEGVLRGEKSNGFGNRSMAIARSLRYTTGSFVAAALFAYENKTVAISPTSGFHHACWDSGGGFCTFNGLMVAATQLVLAGAKNIGILDLDAHYGNGTENIIREIGIQNHVIHHTGANSLEDVRAAIKKFKDCDIILYQAGADPHENDPLGGSGFTSDDLRKRDRIIFEYARKHGIPIAWNLAGGYQEPIQKVIDIHMATLEECFKIYGEIYE